MDEQRQVTAEEETGYGIGAVARRLGVPAPTLRTWNLRYGIGPSRRSPGDIAATTWVTCGVLRR
ncbi:MerR family transcriptional regulator [Streptosporangium lutulentum]